MAYVIWHNERFLIDPTLNLEVAETGVWTCLALSVLVGDPVNQWCEGYHRVGGLRVWVVKRAA